MKLNNREQKIIDWILYLKCNKCFCMLDYTNYSKANSPTWYRYTCKKCMKKYRQDNIEHIKQRDKEYNKNHREQKKIYNDMYREKHKKELIKKNSNRRKNKWYWWIHNKTERYVIKNKIKHDTCCICWSNIKIELHHPDYNKRNEVCIVCNSCHKEIHSWTIECPKPINLLNFKLN